MGARFWETVLIVIVADIVMSLDNVIALVSVSQGSVPLLILGLILSVPALIYGSLALTKMLDELPFLVTGGAVLLGWVAGQMAASDTLDQRLDIAASARACGRVAGALRVLRLYHRAHCNPARPSALIRRLTAVALPKDLDRARPARIPSFVAITRTFLATSRAGRAMDKGGVERAIPKSISRRPRAARGFAAPAAGVQPRRRGRRHGQRSSS